MPPSHQNTDPSGFQPLQRGRELAIERRLQGPDPRHEAGRGSAGPPAPPERPMHPARGRRLAPVAAAARRGRLSRIGFGRSRSRGQSGQRREIALPPAHGALRHHLRRLAGIARRRLRPGCGAHRRPAAVDFRRIVDPARQPLHVFGQFALIGADGGERRRRRGVRPLRGVDVEPAARPGRRRAAPPRRSAGQRRCNIPGRRPARAPGSWSEAAAAAAACSAASAGRRRDPGCIPSARQSRRYNRPPKRR